MFTNQTMVAISIFTLFFLPQIHLLFIILAFQINENFDKIIKFSANLIIQITFLIIIFTTTKHILEQINNILSYI